MGRDERGRGRSDGPNPRIRVERAKISGQRLVAGSSERIVAQTSVCDSTRLRFNFQSI